MKTNFTVMRASSCLFMSVVMLISDEVFVRIVSWSGE